MIYLREGKRSHQSGRPIFSNPKKESGLDQSCSGATRYVTNLFFASDDLERAEGNNCSEFKYALIIGG